MRFTDIIDQRCPFLAAEALFDDPPARKHGKHEMQTTSLLAYHAGKESREKWERQVYEFILSRGQEGCTPDEVAAHFDVPANTTAPRITALVAKGMVRNAWRTRRTRSGRAANVYVAS